MTDADKPLDLLAFEALHELQASEECWCYGDVHTDACMKAQSVYRRLVDKLTHMAELQT